MYFVVAIGAFGGLCSEDNSFDQEFSIVPEERSGRCLSALPFNKGEILRLQALSKSEVVGVGVKKEVKKSKKRALFIKPVITTENQVESAVRLYRQICIDS